MPARCCSSSADAARRRPSRAIDRREAGPNLIVELGMGEDQERVLLDAGEHVAREVGCRHRFAQRLGEAGVDARQHIGRSPRRRCERGWPVAIRLSYAGLHMTGADDRRADGRTRRRKFRRQTFGEADDGMLGGHVGTEKRWRCQPAREATFTTWPVLRCSMAGRKERTPWATPKTLTPNVHAQSPGWLSHSGPSLPATPALLTKRSTLPQRAMTVRASSSTAEASATSQTCACTTKPRLAREARAASARSPRRPPGRP